MKIFKLPDLGEGLPDAEISQWHVKVGDIIKIDDPLVAMETAKALVDVPSPYSGKIVKLYGQPGDLIATDSPLVEFADVEETAVTKDAATVAGKIEVGNTVIHEAAQGIIPTQHTKANVKAMPAVRMLANKLGIDLTTVTGTGPNSHITAQDVECAANALAANPLSETVQIEPLRGVRRAMANAMIQSHTEVVPVTIVDDADIHSWSTDTDITYRVIRAMTIACQKEPSLNAHFDKQTQTRKLYRHVNVGIAMDASDGLFVPVIKQTEKLSNIEIRATINRFKQQVNERNIPGDDLQGSTIQLSNFGTFAGRYATPIIVPPIVAILGTGKIREHVMAIDGVVAIRKIMPLSLTIDHRAVTGGEAARFLKAVIEDLEKDK